MSKKKPSVSKPKFSLCEKKTKILSRQKVIISGRPMVVMKGDSCHYNPAESNWTNKGQGAAKRRLARGW